MICPKCKRDIGELQICPTCEAAAAAPKAAYKRSKIVGLAVFVFLTLTMVLSVVSIVNYFNPPKANYAGIISDYQKNEETAQKKYRNKRLSFYVVLGNRSGDWDVFCNKQFESVNVKGQVSFRDRDDDHLACNGCKYKIAGYVSNVRFDENGNVISISLTHANVLD